MNFLAHLYLSEDSAPDMIGNVLPDFVRGPVDRGLDARVLAGARLHQRVDGFTDQHPDFVRSRARLRQPHGIYAGILVDMFYDHFLAVHWHHYHPLPLGEFIETVHRRFQSHRWLMPIRMQVITAQLAEENWLGSYATVAGLELALFRMSRRLSERFDRPVHLEDALATLEQRRSALLSDFRAFFPQLITFVQSHRDNPAGPEAHAKAGSAKRHAAPSRSIGRYSVSRSTGS